MKRAHQFEVDVGTASLSLRSVPSRGGILGWKGAPWRRGASLNNELLAAQLQGIMAAFILTVRGCVYLCLWMFVFLHTTICISARKASCFFFISLFKVCAKCMCVCVRAFADIDLRSSPTFRISHSILVSSMLLRPNGHSCLSSRLLFSKTIWKQEVIK